MERVSNQDIDPESLSYKAGRRDALRTFYVVVTGRPNLLRDDMIELLRLAVIDAERKLRDISSR